MKYEYVLDIKVSLYTPEELSFFKLLEKDKAFRHLIIAFRRESKIPDEGYNLESDIAQIKAMSRSRLTQIKRLSSTLTYFLKLPNRWVVPFSQIIIIGRAVSNPQYAKMEVTQVNDTTLQISVNEKMGKRRFTELLSKKFDFDGFLDGLPTNPTGRKEHLDQLSYAQELLDGGKTHSEVADILSDELDEEKFLALSANDLRKKLKKYNRYLEKLSDEIKIPHKVMQSLHPVKDS